MIPIATAIAVLMLAACVGAVYASKRINREEPKVRGAPDAAKTSEWSKLAAGHDPENGYKKAAAGCPAYRNLSGIAQDLEKTLPGSMRITLTLKDDAELVRWTLDDNLFPELDMSEREAYAHWSETRGKTWQDRREEIDKACAEGWVQENEADKNACIKEASKIHRLLDTGLSVRVSAPMADGVHTARREYYIRPEEIRRLAGAAPKRIPDVRRHYMAASAAGFRCERCGRSPLSGGTLYVVNDPVTGRNECLCGGCAGSENII